MIPVRGFEAKKVAVFGLARTGLAAARALRPAAPRSWSGTRRRRPRRRPRRGLRAEDLAPPTGELRALVLSPGVPLTHPAPHWTVRRPGKPASRSSATSSCSPARRRRAPHKRPRIVAITGTNGKSTTTALLGHICRQAGRDVRIGGNIGVGVLGLEDMHGGAVYVLELSSYQLDLTSSLKPDVAIILNISPDHLERHGDMDGYVAAKKRILLNQGKGDTAVVGVDDPGPADRAPRSPPPTGAPSCRSAPAIDGARRLRPAGHALRRHRRAGDRDRRPDPRRSLPGRHNWQNAAAAYAAARALGLSDPVAAEGLMTFPGLAHRMETGRRHRQGALRQRLQGHQRRRRPPGLSSYPKVYWIAGGQPKAGGIESLADLFGASPRPIWSARPGRVRRHARRPRPYARCGTIDAAVAPPSPTPGPPARTPSCCSRRPAPRSTSSRLRGARRGLPRRRAQPGRRPPRARVSRWSPDEDLAQTHAFPAPTARAGPVVVDGRPLAAGRDRWP
jgi:UDP-N-acetylmuramoylalanine--D-glutamate ligase